MPEILIVLFIVAVLPIILSASGIYFRVKGLGKFDNKHPRAQQAQLSGAGSRAVAAQQNAWEALIVFAVVVFIAHAAMVDLHSLAIPAYVFLAARLLHPVLYIANLATLRSITFALGWFSCVYIFYVAVRHMQ